MSIDRNILAGKRYSNALVKIAIDKNNFDEILADLSVVCDLFSQNKDIFEFFMNPIIKIQDKKEVLKASFENKILDEVYNFLNILVDKNRINLIFAIKTLFETEINNRKNIVEVVALTAIPMSDVHYSSMKNKLEEKFKKSVSLKNEISSEIIGGVVLKFGDSIIDGSVKTKLDLMKKQLI